MMQGHHKHVYVFDGCFFEMFPSTKSLSIHKKQDYLWVAL